MGRSLAESFPESRETFEEADRVLGRPIGRLCFEGAPEELALTENTQPCLLTVSVAALRALDGRGLRAKAAAGHSLGEYSAHVAAGTLDFGDALRAVQQRARFMQQAVPVGRGAMAAILGLGADTVADLCRSQAAEQVLSPANLNGPTQVVVAGHTEAVERAMEAARAAGARRVVSLPVSAPFHCELMQPAADRLRPVLEAIEFRDPAIPVYCNVDAAPVADGDGARTALVRQVAASVRWAASIQAMVDRGIDTFVEVGPGKVLSGLVRGVDRGLRTYQAGDAEGVEGAVRELAA